MRMFINFLIFIVGQIILQLKFQSSYINHTYNASSVFPSSVFFKVEPDLTGDPVTVFLQNHPKCCQSALPPASNLPSYLDHTLFHIDHLMIYLS